MPLLTNAFKNNVFAILIPKWTCMLFWNLQFLTSIFLNCATVIVFFTIYSNKNDVLVYISQRECRYLCLPQNNLSCLFFIRLRIRNKTAYIYWNWLHLLTLDTVHFQNYHLPLLQIVCSRNVKCKSKQIIIKAWKIVCKWLMVFANVLNQNQNCEISLPVVPENIFMCVLCFPYLGSLSLSIFWLLWLLRQSYSWQTDGYLEAYL